MMHAFASWSVLAFALISAQISLVCCRYLQLDGVAQRSTADRLVQWAESITHLPSLGSKQQRCVPENVHIALHSEPTEMTVMWMTVHSRCPTVVQFWRTGSVKYHRSGSELGAQRTQGGTSSSLTSKDMCGEPARSNGYGKTWQHSVVLTGLEPGEQYAYSVGNDPTEYSFKAAIPVGSPEKLRFIMYGDMGVSNYHSAKAPGASTVLQAVRNEISQQNISLVFHVGDISYGDGKGKVWYNFMEEIGTFAKSTPYMVGVGNHDYDYSKGRKSHDPSNALPFRPKWAKFAGDSRGECGVALQARFMMPENGLKHAPENPPFWYSFEAGLIHFVMLSSEHSIRRHSQQWEWLVSHLKRIDRCRTPWVVVGFHRPLYAIHPHRANRVIAKYLRHQLEDVLVKYGVDVVASGHVHAYSRSCPVVDMHCTPFEQGGILHVITGSGGRKLSNVKKHQPRWVDSAQHAWGFSIFTVEETAAGESEMKVDFMNADTGDITDSITLRNSLRRDNLCSFCYTRSNGTVLRSPSLSKAAGAVEVAADCGFGYSSSDLDTLAQERLAAEHPTWAAVLQDELPDEWMRCAAEELDPEVAASMAGRWSDRKGSVMPSPANGNIQRLENTMERLFALEDPDLIDEDEDTQFLSE